MKASKVVLSDTSFICPVTGKPCVVGATVRLKPTPMEQTPLQLDGDQASAVAAMVEEAERHG